MKKNNKKHILVLLLALFCLADISTVVSATDVGNTFSSGGFSSSHSSSHSSYSGGYSSSSSGDGGIIDLVVDLIFDIIQAIFFLPLPINIAIFLLIVYFVKKSNTNYKATLEKRKIETNMASNYEINELQNEIEKDLEQIRKDDIRFSKFEFESYTKELYLMVEEARERQDCSVLANYVSKEYLEKVETEINILKNKDMHEVFDGQEFLSAEIKDIIFNESHQEILIELFINEKNSIIGNNRDRNSLIKRKNKAIELTFKRNNGVVTNDTRLSVSNCQVCGAPNSIEDNGVCEYCGSNLAVDYTGWVLTNEKIIKERRSIYFQKYSSGLLAIHNNEEQIVSQVQEHDETFNLEEFEAYVSESFIAVQEGWENRDMLSVRKFESDELYRTHKQQIQEYIDKEEYPFLENQQINDIHLNEFTVDGKNEYINVIVDCNLQVFSKNKEGHIISGSDKFKNNGYKLRFKRALGVKSKSQTTASCPKCGAPLEFGESGECMYCQSFVTNGEHGWVLDNYEGLYQFRKNNANYQKTIFEKMKVKRAEQQSVK